MTTKTSESRDNLAPEDDQPIQLSRIWRALRPGLPAIALSVAGVALAYAVVATLAVLLSPSQRSLSLPFRVEFQGAERGLYPNGTKFSSFEIVATPVLMRVYQANGLGRFLSFKEFSDSIFILESNRALDELNREYVARLSDPKLSPIDRERIETEYREKRASLARNEFAITYASDKKELPKALVSKVLGDTLTTWADIAAKEKGVLKYQLPVLSERVMKRDLFNSPDTVVALDILRTRIDTITRNIEELEAVPGAKVLRGGPDNLSLAEIRLGLADTMRFRVQPLLRQLRAENASPDPTGTIRFLESQLAYNERQLQGARGRVNALRETFRLYEQERGANPDEKARGVVQQNETVMPQLSDSFLDRLIELMQREDDVRYRQEMVDRINSAALEVLPFEQEVAYYTNLISQMRGIGGTPSPSAQIRDEMALIVAEVSRGITHVTAVYELLSLNLNPSTVLFSVTSPPVARTERALSVQSLALWGFVLILVTIPIAAIVVLVRQRLRDEEAAYSTATTRAVADA